MRTHSILVFSLACGLLGGSAAGGVVHVAKNGPIDTIQGGVDAAAPGDTIKIEAGVYQELITIGVADVTLAANGKVVVDGRAPGGGGLGPVIRVEAEDVTLKKLVVRNAATQAFQEGVGVLVTADGFAASKCVIIGCEFAGLRLANSAVARIKGCTFRANQFNVEAINNSDASFSKCKFEGGIVGIVLDGTDGARLSRCSFRGHDDGAIFSNNNAPSGVEVTDCKFQTAGAAIGMEVEDLLVEGCEFNDTPFDSVFVLVNTGAIRDNKFDGVNDGDFGIVVFSTGAFVVEDNEMERCMGGAIAAIASAPGLVIRNNRIRNCGFGTAMVDVGGAEVVIEDNDIADCAGSGIRLDGDDCELVDNVVKTCTEDGIFVEAQADASRLLENFVQKCLNEGLDHRGTNSLIRENVLRKNRLDLTNNGTAVFKKNEFKTGGENVAPELD